MKKLTILLTAMTCCCLTCFGQAEKKTWTYGDHTYTQQGTLTAKEYNKKATGVVTFTNIPSDYEEFEALYTQFLGKTPHGTAAMMVMAMEIYGRDRAMGKECIKLINYPSNVNSVIPRLNDKYGTSAYAPENGYCPQEPYTIEMKASVNQHQELQITGPGRVMYIYMMGKGWDTEQRSVEIIRQPKQPLYKIFNCPALYTQCKTIHGTWQGLK